MMAADGLALDVAECKMRSKSWWSAWPLRTGIGATGEYRERWPIWAMRSRGVNGEPVNWPGSSGPATAPTGAARVACAVAKSGRRAAALRVSPADGDAAAGRLGSESPADVPTISGGRAGGADEAK